MTDTDNVIKPIRYRFNSHNAQPMKRRKTRVTKPPKKPAAAAGPSVRETTPSRINLSQSLTSGSRTTAPLGDCVLFFAHQNEEERDVGMSQARSLGAQLAQSANESTHVVLHVPHPNKKQQQQFLSWREEGKWVVSLTWVRACMSTWSHQAEFNYPPGRGDHSLVTGDQQRHTISINPFHHHEPPPAAEDELEHQSNNETLKSSTLSYHSAIDSQTTSPPPPTSIQKLADIAAQYDQPLHLDRASSSTNKVPSNQQKIRHAMMAPHSSDPNIKIWTEEKMTPEGLMEKHRSGRRKSMRLGYSRK
ncbi:hypothetical protein K450DRAFT_257030 [Umbelopsis ramanniana AG]|uniref:BRCT domain-containing protein n=1 Tax=Umbelopsis ramanniana AG TaxID=1314678 RepID=A0AAD5E2T0_UMBRA|nr:uncharacterized protein K450DRAFT_257030 [Umbelopsis ramanniana AG]KAI8576381.1 hypothetical protein K450DRAFT_257030 [Umbelopsis ramanniana AG]